MWTAAAVSLLLISACAGKATTDGSAAAAPGETAAARVVAAPVIRVRQSGGFASPSTYLTRLPLVSVYADGRVITQGPQIAIYPGPALPSLQVQQIDPAAVRTLIDKAVAAGVRPGADLGRPPIADALSTRFTVITDAGQQSVEVMGLAEATADQAGLSAAQRAARARLATLLEQLTDVKATLGAAASAEPQQYVPSALVAAARPYSADGVATNSPEPAVPWPGPALPGPLLNPGADVGCVTVAGDTVSGVLSAAGSANAMTPWTWGGRQWSVTLRPLLPDETDCASLKAGMA